MWSIFSVVKARAFYYVNRAMIRSTNSLFRSILDTRPIESYPNTDCAVYSVLGKRGRNAYLVAAKSLMQHGTKVALVVQDDGTLTSRCRAILSYHLPGVLVKSQETALQELHENVPADIRRVIPPFNGCNLFIYYQLLCLLYGLRYQRVIQLDSDIIFIKRPSFILRWIAEGQSPCFHSDGGNSLATRFRKLEFQFPRVQIERFSAGLFGISGRPADATVAAVLERLMRDDPQVFQEWEGAQAIWSVLLNDFSAAVCLDDLAPGYVGNGWRNYDELAKKATVVHFVGTTRFRNLTYLKMARHLAKCLRTPDEVYEVL